MFHVPRNSAFSRRAQECSCVWWWWLCVGRALFMEQSHITSTSVSTQTVAFPRGSPGLESIGCCFPTNNSEHNDGIHHRASNTAGQNRDLKNSSVPKSCSLLGPCGMIYTPMKLSTLLSFLVFFLSFQMKQSILLSLGSWNHCSANATSGCCLALGRH